MPNNANDALNADILSNLSLDKISVSNSLQDDLEYFGRDYGKNVRCRNGGSCREGCRSACNTKEVIDGIHTRERGGLLAISDPNAAAFQALANNAIASLKKQKGGDIGEHTRSLVEGYMRSDKQGRE